MVDWKIGVLLLFLTLQLIAVTTNPFDSYANTRIEFKPQDCWIGAFWKREGENLKKNPEIAIATGHDLHLLT